MHRLRSIRRLKQCYFLTSNKAQQVPPLLQMWQRCLSQDAQDSASCVYRNGFVVLTLPMPSRNEQCEFTLRPISDTVKNLVTHAQEEDGGIDRFALYSLEGTRISNSTPIDILMQQDFQIVVNDKRFDIIPPKPEQFPVILEDQLSSTKNLISQLYSDINVQEFKGNRERSLKVHLESLRTELNPLEEQKALIDSKSAQRTNFLVWAGLGYMALQFGFLARLTWWEYSWDIMEPVTYFVTYATSIICYGYFVLTKQDCNYPEVKSRSHLLSFYRTSDKHQFDVNEYNAKKELVAKLEQELKFLNNTPDIFVESESKLS